MDGFSLSEPSHHGALSYDELRRSRKHQLCRSRYSMHTLFPSGCIMERRNIVYTNILCGRTPSAIALAVALLLENVSYCWMLMMCYLKQSWLFSLSHGYWSLSMGQPPYLLLLFIGRRSENSSADALLRLADLLICRLAGLSLSLETFPLSVSMNGLQESSAFHAWNLKPDWNLSRTQDSCISQLRGVFWSSGRSFAFLSPPRRWIQHPSAALTILPSVENTLLSFWNSIQA